MAARKLTPEDFAQAVIQRLGIQPTKQNVRAVVGWERAEGGHWNNQARFNPLNTTQPEPGAGNTGSQGNIKVYNSWDQGLKATVDTLRNGRYGPILKALRANNPEAVASAIGQTPWGTNPSLVRQTIANTAESHLRQHAAGYFGQAQPREQTQSVQLGRQQTFDQAGYDQARKRFVLAGMIAKHNPDSVLLKTGLLSTAAPSPQDFAGSRLTSKTVTSTAPALKTTHAKQAGVATFEGKKVAAWIAPLLQYARENGWKGTITSGYRSDAEQKAIYDRGTRPAAKPISEGGGGSNHSRTGYLQGAVDVSDAATLDRILRRKGSRLKWAGAKDPVHFSVPRGGSY